MLLTKFRENQPACSGEEDFWFKLYFDYFIHTIQENYIQFIQPKACADVISCKHDNIYIYKTNG